MHEHESKTHFEQIPVETVKKIAQELPAEELREADAIGDGAVNVETPDKAASPRERWHEVAQKVQQEEDPQKMIGLVQQLIATFDAEQAHKRLPHTRDSRKQSGHSEKGQS